MGFEREHNEWLCNHLKQRKGERLDALKRGHGYGNRLFVERVWWPLAGHFHGLHPEYEVKDWRGRSYFVDVLWEIGASRIAFEIMDYGSHGTDRSKYRMDLNRGLFLQSQDCTVLYISLDELKENPSFILSALQNILFSYLLAEKSPKITAERAYSRIERDLMRAAIRHHRVLRPADAARELELHTMTIIKYCRRWWIKVNFARWQEVHLSGSFTMNILAHYKVQIWFEDEVRRENVNGKSNTICRW